MQALTMSLKIVYKRKGVRNEWRNDGKKTEEKAWTAKWNEKKNWKIITHQRQRQFICVYVVRRMSSSSYVQCAGCLVYDEMMMMSHKRCPIQIEWNYYSQMIRIYDIHVWMRRTFMIRNGRRTKWKWNIHFIIIDKNLCCSICLLSFSIRKVPP